MTDLNRLKARHVMTGPVRTIPADWPLQMAARFFMDNHFSGAPVIDEVGEPVGVLTLKDLARYTEWHLEIEEKQERLRELRVDAGPEPAPAHMHLDRMPQPSVRSVMTPRIRTVDVDAPLPDVLGVLLEGPFHRVFVRAKDGHIEGVISSLDVVRTMKRHYEETKRRKVAAR